MTGEERRKWLQRIRRRIAEHNDIVYMQSEQHEKDCAGDCRVCQAEARYIDVELSRKAKLGEEVRLSVILSELLMDVDLTLGVRDREVDDSRPKPSIIYIQSISGKSDVNLSPDNTLSRKSDVKPDVSAMVDAHKKEEAKSHGSKKGATSIDDLNLTIHLDSAVKRYGIDNTDELYTMLKNDSVNMKKKLRGGYRYLVERLKELGYEITEEMT